MRNFFKVSTSFLLMLGLSGCGSDGSSATSSSYLTFETKSSKFINTEKTEMAIEFVVQSSYGNDVEVSLSDLNINVSPCKIVGTPLFNPSHVAVNQTISAQIKFSESCTPTSYTLNGKTLLRLDGKDKEVSFNSGDKTITAIQGVSVITNPTDTNTTTTPVVVGDVKLPIVVIPTTLKEIVLNTNSKSIEIPIKVFKDVAPFASGSVKVELPLKVLNGADVGLFEAYEVPVNSQGIATFKYTGPSNLKYLMDNNDSESIFKFYHVANSKNKQSVKVSYQLEPNSYIPIDYALSVTTQGNEFSMGIPNVEKTFSVVLKDTKGKLIKESDINITKITVRTENALIAELFDTTSQTVVNNVILRNENNSAFILRTKKLSGIAPIRVTVDFKDINGELKTLSTIVNVRVMSGPPSAISISYVSTGQDAERAKYEEKFAISVTDEYGNKVNTKPYISIGAIVGYAVDGREASFKESNDTKRLFYGQKDVENGIANGAIDTLDASANTTNFEDNTNERSDVFKWVNAEGVHSDKLVVFGKGKNYEAMGKWDFSKIDNNTLALEDDYFGIDRADLSYAIGHNYYQDQCLDDSREWLGSTDSESYQLDDEGTVIVSYKYDYHLTGKDALVWVNLNGYQADTEKNTRIGEVTKHTLRGNGLIFKPLGGYTLDKGASGYAIFDIWHEKVPEPYRNAHFGYALAAGSTCSYTLVNTSNLYDARTCNNGRSSEGRAYVTYYIEAPVDKGCSFNITDIMVSDEF